MDTYISRVFPLFPPLSLTKAKPLGCPEGVQGVGRPADPIGCWAVGAAELHSDLDQRQRRVENQQAQQPTHAPVAGSVTGGAAGGAGAGASGGQGNPDPVVVRQGVREGEAAGRVEGVVGRQLRRIDCQRCRGPVENMVKHFGHWGRDRRGETVGGAAPGAAEA